MYKRQRHCLLIILILLINCRVWAQERWIDRKGTIRFFSDAPLEDIQAINNQAMAILDQETNNVAVSMLMREFDFPNELMEEHFNENYIESEQYPKATFTGRLEDDIADIKSGQINTKAVGEITLHGITKPLSTEVSLNFDKSTVEVETKFMIRLEDFEIDIPSVVMMKIAEEVEVTSNFTLKPIQK